jgi:hypothetical protein
MLRVIAAPKPFSSERTDFTLPVGSKLAELIAKAVLAVVLSMTAEAAKTFRSKDALAARI